MHHPIIGWIITFFLGTAGGVAGSMAVSAAKKDEQKTPTNPESKVSGDPDDIGGPLTLSCDWRRATNKDLDREIVAAYVDQLKTPVGTHRTIQHNGKTWLLETVSSATDPDFTKHEKDVRGWIRVKDSKDFTTTIENIVIEQKSLPAQGIIPVNRDSTIVEFDASSGTAPIARRPIVATLMGEESEQIGSVNKMKIENGNVVTDNSVDDLGKGPLTDVELVDTTDTNLGITIPIKKVEGEKKFGLSVSEKTISDGKWGVKLKERKDGGIAVPVKVKKPGGPGSAPPTAKSGPSKKPPVLSKNQNNKSTSSVPKTPPAPNRK